MKKKVLALLMSTAMIVSLLAGCGAPAAADPKETEDEGTKKEETVEGIPADEIKIGFVHVSDASDMGYTYNHDLGTK